MTSIDVEDRAGALDFIADIQSMPELEDESFDTILCSQVLEHVPRPANALGEFARVLRAGGAAIITVPHLSVIHEAPHDYYRYTRYGLEELCSRADLTVKQIEPTGGLGCFLLHGLSAALLSTLGVVPIIGAAVVALNYVFLVRIADWFEPWIGFASLYPCDYLLIAQRESTSAEPAEAVQ